MTTRQTCLKCDKPAKHIITRDNGSTVYACDDCLLPIPLTARR